MPNAGMGVERALNQRLGGTAMTAPRAAELEQRRAGERVDLGACRLVRGSIDLRFHDMGAAKSAPTRL